MSVAVVYAWYLSCCRIYLEGNVPNPTSAADRTDCHDYLRLSCKFLELFFSFLSLRIPSGPVRRSRLIHLIIWFSPNSCACVWGGEGRDVHILHSQQIAMESSIPDFVVIVIGLKLILSLLIEYLMFQTINKSIQWPVCVYVWIYLHMYWIRSGNNRNQIINQDPRRRL